MNTTTHFYSIAAACTPTDATPLGEDYFLDVDAAGRLACITKRYTDASFLAEFGEGFLLQPSVPLCFEGVEYDGPQALYDTVFKNRTPDRTGQMVNTRWFTQPFGYVWKFKD